MGWIRAVAQSDDLLLFSPTATLCYVFSPDCFTRFRARFRKVQKVPVQILKVQSLGEVPEGSGAEVPETSGAENRRGSVRCRSCGQAPV